MKLHAMAEYAPGKLIIAGDLDRSGLVTVVRLNEDGSLDPTFAPASVGKNEYLRRYPRRSVVGI